LALAKVALVAIGNYSFPWQAFESFIRWLPGHKLNPETRPQLAKAATRVSKASCDKNFSSQFLRTLHLSASDPRDKIFGILGISAFKGTRIVPDYTRSLEEVLLNTAITMIREATLAMYYFMPFQPSRANGSLEFLSGLPSWVPDLLAARAPYTSGRYSITVERASAYHFPDSVLGAVVNGFMAQLLDDMCSILPFEPATFSPDLHKLIVPGVLFGTIVETSGELLNHIDNETSISDQIQIMQRLYDSIPGPRGIAMASMIRLLRYKDSPIGESPDTRAAIETFDSDFHQVNNLTRSEKYNTVSYMVSNAADRILFVTDNNKIGLAYHPDATHGIRPGDVVAGLFGINFPFILRPVGGGDYRMINVARVHTMGWGHNFLGNKPSRYWETTFDISRAKDTQRRHRKEDRKDATDITWRDYEHHGMREFVIV
jgi:hypothetical protein